MGLNDETITEVGSGLTRSLEVIIRRPHLLLVSFWGFFVFFSLHDGIFHIEQKKKKKNQAVII